MDNAPQIFTASHKSKFPVCKAISPRGWGIYTMLKAIYLRMGSIYPMLKASYPGMWKSLHMDETMHVKSPPPSLESAVQKSGAVLSICNVCPPVYAIPV